MKHIKKLKIDIDKKNFEVIPSVEHDSNTRFLHIQLLNDSVPFDITGCSVILSGTKEDGNSIFNSCDVINSEIGFIEAEITEQMNAIPGHIDCEIKVYDGEGVLTSKKFTIKVTPSQTSRSVVSSNEFKALTDALNKAQSIDNKADKKEVEKLSSQLDTMANEKLDKNGIVTMANMGQDVKEAMTGGSVAVVGKDTVLTENIVDKQITGAKLDNEVAKSTYIIANKINDYKIDTANNWASSYCNLEASNNELSITGIGSGYGGSSNYYTDYNTKLTGLNGHKLYIKYCYNVMSENATRVRLRLKSGSLSANVFDLTDFTKNSYNSVSKIFETPSDWINELQYGIAVYFNDRDSATNVITKLKNIVILDLTELYGIGNEPSVEVIDELLNGYNNYFGSVNLFNAKEVQVNVKENTKKINEFSKDIVLLAKNYLSDIKNDMWGLTETTITGTGTSSKLTSYVSFAEFIPTTNKTLYFKVKAKVLESGCEKIQAIINGTSGTQKVVEIVNPVANKEYELSLSDNLLNHKGSATNVSINAIYPNKETQSGKHLIYSCGVVLDLTETFGEGNEPNTKVIDCLLTKFYNKHFYGTENIFSSNVLKTLRNDLYSYKGEYIKTNELGNILIGSVPNVNWENWQLDQYSYGMSKHDIVPIYNYIHGVLETDAMFSVWAKYSRWSPDCVYSTEGGHEWGGHIFEGWNRPRTYRYTVLIGKNAVNETCIFTFAPPSPEVEGEEGGGGTFGITRVGSDKPKEGFEIKQKEAIMNGSLKITEKLMIPYKNITTSTTEGVRGQFAHNDNYLFLCVNDNYWKRVPLESF